MELTTRQLRVRILLDHVYNVAKEYDDLHKETKKDIEGSYGPFQTIDDTYSIINLLDNNKFSVSDIANLDAAIQSQAHHDDMSDAGLSLLKILMSILSTGATALPALLPLI